MGESPRPVESEEEFEVEDQDMDMEFLKGGYIRLNRARKQADSKIDEVNQQLRSILKILEKPDSATRPQMEPGSSQHQVYSQNWE